MMWLYFNSQADAQSAMDTINSRLGLPNETTHNWATIKQCVNGTWGFIKPACDLSDIPQHTEKHFDKVIDLGLPNSASDAETE